MLRMQFESDNGTVMYFTEFAVNVVDEEYAAVVKLRKPAHECNNPKCELDKEPREDDMFVKHEALHDICNFIGELADKDPEELEEISVSHLGDLIALSGNDRDIFIGENSVRFGPYGLFLNGTHLSESGVFVMQLLLGIAGARDYSDFYEFVVTRDGLIEMLEFFLFVHDRITKEESLAAAIMKAEEERIEQTGDSIHTEHDDLDTLLKKGIISL